MAAFTEGFDDVSGGAGKGTEHLGKAIGKILEARQLASDERRYAEKELFKQAPHLSLEDLSQFVGGVLLGGESPGKPRA